MLGIYLVLVCICTNLASAASFLRSVYVNVGILSSDLYYDDIVPTTGAVNNTVFVGYTPGCFDFCSCPVLHPLPSGVGTLLNYLPLVYPVPNLFLYNTNDDLVWSGAIPTFQSVVIHDGSHSQDTLVLLENVTSPGNKWNYTIGRFLFQNPPQFIALSTVLTNSISLSSRMFYDGAEKATYFISSSSWTNNITALRLCRWSFQFGAISCSNLTMPSVDPPTGQFMLAFAYSQFTATPYILTSDGSIYAINKPTGHLSLIVQTFPPPQGSNLCSTAYPNHLIADDSNGYLYYQVQINPFYVQINLRTLAVRKIPFAGVSANGAFGLAIVY